MDVLAKMVGTIVADSLKADDEMREMMDINNNPTGEWEKHRKYENINVKSSNKYFLCIRSVQSAVRSLLKSMNQEETWMMTQARRKREKEDMLNKNPGMDPVFMKV